MDSAILSNIGLIVLGLVAVYVGAMLVMTWLAMTGRLHRLERALRPYRRYFSGVGMWMLVTGVVGVLVSVSGLLLVYLLAHPEALWGLPQ